MKTIIIGIIAVVMLISCQEKEEIIEENNPLQISITSPTHGNTVNNSVIISTNYITDQDVNSVEFYIDNVLIATVSDAPFEINWNTRNHLNGTHTLFFKIKDKSNNEVTSNSIQVVVENILFIANFTNDWLRDDYKKGILIISDKEGEVLAERTWIGNASFSVDLPEDIIYNDAITITTIRQHNGRVKIKTYLEVPVGSNWTWKGIPTFIWSEAQNQVTFDFVNIPDNNAYILSSSELDLNRDNSLPTNTHWYYNEKPMDFYLKLDTDVTPKYKWINGVSSINKTVDLSSMEETTSKTINFPTSVRASISLRGYLSSGDRYSGGYLLDTSTINNSSTIDIDYPPGSITDFRTEVVLGTMYYSDPRWSHVVYGEIPNSFEKIDVDFSLVNDSVDDFKITTTNSDFDYIKSHWYLWFDDSDSLFSWYVYSSPSNTQYKLPVFSNSVSLLYPRMIRESFYLSSIEVTDHSELNTYEEFLETAFHSSDYFYNIVNDNKTLIKYFY